MRSAIAVTGITLIVVALMMPPTVIATGSLLSDFRATYPSVTGTKLDSCITCHATSSGGALNAYGAAMAANGNSFSAIENVDSDGDGFANGEEIEGGTFPGDASDFPSGGGGGGGGRIRGRIDVSTADDVVSAALAADGDRDETLAVWVERSDVARAGATVRAQLIDDDGQLVGKPSTLDKGDVADATEVSAGYGKKTFLAGWLGADGALLVRTAKAKNGKAAKGPTVVVVAAEQPSIGWDGDTGSFVVASTADGGVGVDRVTTKGTVTGRLPARTEIPELDGVVGVAAGEPAAGAVLVGTVAAGSKGAPAGVLIDNGVPGQVSAAYGKNQKGAPQGGAAFGDEGGLAAWTQARKIWVAPLNDDGSAAGKAVKLKAKNVGRVAVGVQDDGGFLVVWTDTRTGKLWGIDVDGAGRAGKAFELQDTGESVDPEVLAVARVGDLVIVAYAVSGSTEQLRGVGIGTE